VGFRRTGKLYLTGFGKRNYYLVTNDMTAQDKDILMDICDLVRIVDEF
jgi:hypothetical protein